MGRSISNTTRILSSCFIALFTCLIMATLMLTGCSAQVIGFSESSSDDAAVEVQASKESNSGESKAPAEDSYQDAEGDQQDNDESKPLAESPFVGTWNLVKAVTLDDSNTPVDISTEEIEAARAKGVDTFLVLNDDGTAVRVVYGVYSYGAWSQYSDGTGNMIIDDLDYSLSLDGTQLTTLAYGVIPYEYEKTDAKETISEEDYMSAKEAFEGKWTLVSALMDGRSVDGDSLRLAGHEFSFEINDDMWVTSSVGEDEYRFPWGIVDRTTIYIENPVDGTLMTVREDGLMGGDFGPFDDALFKKE